VTDDADVPRQKDERETPRPEWLELVAVIVLSVTTILTAWSAFQASKWGGAMSIAFSEASSARIESTRLDGAADVRTANQLGLWTEWASATADEDVALATFLVDRFPQPLATAHEDWLAAGGPSPDGPASPFDMSSFVMPERVEAVAANDRAGERFAAALANNQRGDNYTVLTVLFASVLFFTAMSGRVRAVRSQQVLLGMGLTLGLLGLVLLATFPKLV
jgi:hypothetical protein